ncbi:MAG: FecR domain-containing protein [Candidatus Cloacimonetes bacterium]|nr:FecR domain-containing protein [Candidatus Cloacimonadota bacterium]
MNRILIIAILLLGILGALPATEAVAIISASKGKVELVRNNKPVRFKTGDMVFNNDQIKTGGESFAAVKYLDGSSTVKIFSNSVVRINAAVVGNNMNKNTTVSRGSANSSVRSGGGSYTVQTPTTVASVKGTDFLTKIIDDYLTLIIVTDGVVLVKNTVTNREAEVPSGRTAKSDDQGSLDVVESSDDDLSEAERLEMESQRETQPRSMRIQFTDELGNIKYVEVRF